MPLLSNTICALLQLLLMAKLAAVQGGLYASRKVARVILIIIKVILDTFSISTENWATTWFTIDKTIVMNRIALKVDTT